MSSVKCPQCNLTNWATALNCKRCGLDLQSFEGGMPEGDATHTTFGNQQYQPDSDNTQYQSPGYQPNYQQNWSQPNYQAHQQTYYQQPQLKSGMAIASMVLGIIGCFLTAPIGLILGIVSLKRANKRPYEYGGKGFAIAGVILNSIGILVIPIIAAIAIPNLMAARRSANEASAISTIRTISGAEETYRATVGAGRYGDLKALQSAGLIDQVTASGQKNGYRFIIVILPTMNGGVAINATPMTKSHGTRSFYFSSEDGVMRAASKNGLLADSNDLPMDSQDSSPSIPYPKSADRSRNPYSR